jgi:hypothetical protein
MLQKATAVATNATVPQTHPQSLKWRRSANAARRRVASSSHGRVMTTWLTVGRLSQDARRTTSSRSCRVAITSFTMTFPSAGQDRLQRHHRDPLPVLRDAVSNNSREGFLRGTRVRQAAVPRKVNSQVRDLGIQSAATVSPQLDRCQDSSRCARVSADGTTHSKLSAVGTGPHSIALIAVSVHPIRG